MILLRKSVLTFLLCVVLLASGQQGPLAARENVLRQQRQAVPTELAKQRALTGYKGSTTPVRVKPLAGVIRRLKAVNSGASYGGPPGGFFSATLLPISADPFREIVKGDFNGDGKTDVATIGLNEDPKLGDFAFWIAAIISKGNGTFQPSVLTGLSAMPYFLVGGDVNKDGKTDILAVGSSNIGVWLSNGDGSFSPSNLYSPPIPYPDTGVITDINGDGNPDVLIHAFNYSVGSYVMSMEGDGTGSFMNPVSVALDNPNESPLFADVNDDGKLDVLGYDYTTSHELQVFLANANGYMPHAIYPISGGLVSFGMTLSVGDVNNDGKVDILAADGRTMVYLNQGAGTFAPGEPRWTGFSTTAVTVADVNRDGKADLVAANSWAADITISLGKGDGTFVIPKMGYAVGGTPPVHPVVADFNGDGNPDVITSDGSQNLVYSENYGDGTYAAAANYYSSKSIGSNVSSGTGWSEAITDLNNDGYSDVVLGRVGSSDDPGISVFVANGNGTFKSGTSYAPQGGASGRNMGYVALTDLNGDGKLDVISSDWYDGKLYGMLGKGDGTFGSVTTLIQGLAAPQTVISGDFDKDGKVDAAVFTWPSVTVILNVASTSPTTTTYPLSAAGYGLASDDLNGDGYADLVAAETEGANIAVLLNKGDGTFQPAAELPVFGDGLISTGEPFAVVIGDLNSDGKLDLAFSLQGLDYENGSMQYIGLMTGNGDGTYNAAIYYPATARPTLWVQPFPSELNIADINGDGRADLIYTNMHFNTVAILYNSGYDTYSNPTYFSAREFASGGYVMGLALGDLNKRRSVEYVAASRGFPGITTSMQMLPDYTVVFDRTKATVTAGQSLSFLLTITPKAGFNSTVAFSCGQIPKGTTCTFEPSSLQPNGAPLTTKLTFTTSGPYLAAAPTGRKVHWSLFWASLTSIGMIGIVVVGVGSHRRTMLIVLSGLAFTLLVAIVGCGSSSPQQEGPPMNPNATPPGIYTVQVVSQAATAKAKSMPLTITVR